MKTKMVMVRAPIKETTGWYKGQFAKHDDYYEDVKTASDFYTVFCGELKKYYSEVEVWYQENDEHPVGVFHHSNDLVERFHRKGFSGLSSSDFGDIVFIRGDTRKYLPLLESLAWFESEKGKNIFKIYYPAGNYFIPPDIVEWDLIFVDDERHFDPISKIFDRNKIELFKKSCVDKYFPARKGKGAVDVCFVCNAPQHQLKRLDFFKEIMTELTGEATAYCIGWKDKELMKFFRGLPVYFTGFIPRYHVGELMARCKLGLVLSNKKDGSPRVIQEFLCCNLPVIISRETSFSTMYINDFTGIALADNEIVNGIRYILRHYESYEPRKYFVENLIMSKAARWFVDCIKKHGGPVPDL